MDAFALPASHHVDKYVFGPNSASDGASWHVWKAPKGKSRLMMLVIGGGGGGGSGVVGANSTAAGGGGGGSGGQTVVEIPLDLLPPTLYISVGHAKTGTGVKTYVSTMPQTFTNNVVAIANGGGAGGNASGATAGTAGAAGAIATNATMSLGWAFAKLALVGQAGVVGGTTVSANNLSYPTTGLRVTGGAGGGGLPAAAATGTNGGGILAIGSPSFFLGVSGGVGSATATNPADNGQHGKIITEAGLFFTGGTGGASTHGTATGGGLVQSSGGNGQTGCGGGGMGGALTSSAAGTLSKGGSGLVMFWCY